MRNFIIFVLILGVIGFLVKPRTPWAEGANPGDSGPITNPVYAEVRFQADLGDRTIHLVAIGKGRDDADCKRMLGDLPDRMQGHRKPDGTSLWNIESTDCRKSLDARSAKLFDNQPTFVTYLSASPHADDPTEREMRMIFWGVTVRESELVCNEISTLKDRWKGSLNCVHALASQ